VLYRFPVLTDEELTRFAAGDPDAVRAVYREYSRMVFVICRRLLRSSDLAEEAAQQTFVKAWRSAGTVRPGPDLAPWLATIARRTAIDVYRREARHEASTLDDAPVTHPALIDLPVGIDRLFDVWQVREALDELTGDERIVVQLQHLDGMTQAAVAEQLKLPLGTVKSRSYRAHRKLAARLGHLRQGFEDL
jgi:RNA polymerase sigma factor (sigma-70 family)